MLSQRLLVSKWLSPYRDVHGKQTGCYHRDCWSANGCEVEAAQPSRAVWRETAGLTQYWLMQYTKRAPLVNSSDVGPMTRLSVDTSDHRDVRTVTWNHGSDGLWSESHVSFVAVGVWCLPVHLFHRCLAIGIWEFIFLRGVYQFTFLTGVYKFTFLTGVYQFTFLTGSTLTCWHTPSAISTKTPLTQTVQLWHHHHHHRYNNTAIN